MINRTIIKVSPLIPNERRNFDSYNGSNGSEDIDLPRQWILQNEMPQRPVSNSHVNISNIDGTVRISFDERFKRTVDLDDLPTATASESSNIPYFIIILLINIWLK